jgi:hypothetical protein
LLGHRVKRDKPRGSNVGTDAELKERKNFFRCCKNAECLSFRQKVFMLQKMSNFS